MSDRVPIVYDTPEIGRRLRELERQRLANLRHKPLVLPPGMIILSADDKTPASYPANVTAAFVLYESKTRPVLALIHSRDRNATATFMKMVDFLREEFSSVTPAPDHRIILTAEDASRLAEQLRASRE